MNENRLICGRSEESFEDRQLAVCSSRNVYTIGSDGYLAAVEVRVLTHEEALARFDKIGGLTVVETYSDMRNGFTVLRGYAERAGGLRFYFSLPHDVLYEAVVDATVSAMEYSIRSSLQPTLVDPPSAPPSA